ARHPGELRCAGCGRVSRRELGEAQVGQSRTLSAHAGEHPVRPPRHARRDRRCRAVPGLTGGALGDRPDARRGWRAISLTEIAKEERRMLGRRTLLATGAAVAVASRARAAQFTYKFGNNLPLTHPLNIRLQEAIGRIREATKGAVEIQVFPNNQLGGDTDMLSQVRSGAIQFLTQSGLIFSTIVPIASINGIGFAFKDYAQVWP